MRSDWCYWMNCFTSKQCDDIIKSALKLPATEPTLGYNSGVADASYRRSSIRWIEENNAELSYVFDLFWKYQLRINRDWFNFHVTDLPSLQFTEYDSSYKGEYKDHQDIFWVNPTNKHRKMTMILQLSAPSDYEGGNLILQSHGTGPSADDAIAMKHRGTIISFTSCTTHRLEPVTAGKRYSLVAWFEGPKFV